MQVNSIENIVVLVAEKYKIDLKLLQTKSSSAASFEPYTFKVRKGADGNLEVKNPQIDALQVTTFGRFGNAIIQLAHAVHVAEILGVKKLFAPEAWFLLTGARKLSNGIEFISGKDGAHLDVVLAGSYYHIQHLLRPKSRPDMARNVSLLRKTLAFPEDLEPFSDEELIIHIRSGDIFRSTPLPHPGYAQPPLAFYLKVIESKRWLCVTLVYENEDNPVIPALKQYCESSGQVYKVVSGQLRNDVETLLRAKNLVCSVGTFTPIILLISGNIDVVYLFQTCSVWVRPYKRKYIVYDSVGQYINGLCSQNWINSGEQRKLMVDYPVANLTITMAD